MASNYIINTNEAEDADLDVSNPPSPNPKLPRATDAAPAADDAVREGGGEEVLAAGKVDKPVTNNDVAPVTPVSKKKKAAADPSAPKKPKKPRKKGLVSASPSLESGPRYYYDIQNFIVTNGVDLEQFGLLPKSSEPTVRTTVSSTGGKQVSALPAKEKTLYGQELRCEETESLSTYTYPNGVEIQAPDPASRSAYFCPDCGLRLSKHKEKRGTRKGVPATFFVCPIDLVA